MARRSSSTAGNPLFNQRAFTDAADAAPWAQAKRLTVDGVTSKTALLLILVVISAAFTWNATISDVGPTASTWPLLIGSGLIGLVLVVATGFRPAIARVTAPVYAVVEGVFVGVISGTYSALYDGIVPLAVGLTFAVTATMLALYQSRLIRVTEKFRTVIVVATGGIFVFYLATLILRIAGANIPLLHDLGPIGILISLGITVIAALNLLLDFDFIERAVRAGAPARTEWYAAFGLLVTLVWLYLELLRLLSLLTGRD